MLFNKLFDLRQLRRGPRTGKNKQINKQASQSASHTHWGISRIVFQGCASGGGVARGKTITTREVFVEKGNERDAADDDPANTFSSYSVGNGMIWPNLQRHQPGPKLSAGGARHTHSRECPTEREAFS